MHLWNIDIKRGATLVLVAAGLMIGTAMSGALAQSSDNGFRINQLEDQVRQLNGKIEEMNFQLLQLQEQMRRMQEDNEYRFQELEEKRQGGLNDKGGLRDSSKQLARKADQKALRLEKPQPSELTDVISNSGGEARIVKTAKKSRELDGVELFVGPNVPKPGDGREVPLGTITFDSLGQVVDTALGKPLDLTARLRQPDDPVAQTGKTDIDTQLASITSARELYDLGYGYFQAGDYLNSEKAFAEFGERFSDDNKMPNAQFWLGESMFSQRNFEGAAKVFLDAHSNWPDARIAPQTLLKLGVSLAGMQQRELACATYVKVYKNYPDMSGALQKRTRAEQKSARCLNR